MASTDGKSSRSEAEQKQAGPAIALPKGGGAVRGIGEKFAANPVTGTGSMSVPIATSPGRSGFGPQLSLSYDSGSGNGPFGFGWSLSLPSITRKSDKGLPQYLDAVEDDVETDVFILSGSEDLVPVLMADKSRFKDTTTAPGYVIHRYRPRIEGLFARIERWTRTNDGDVHWRSISRENILTLYGQTPESRIADPEDPRRIFTWLICETRDDKGNAALYGYKPEDGAGVELTRACERNRGDRDDVRRSANRYLKNIRYGNRGTLLNETGRRPRLLNDLPSEQLLNAGWMFEVDFDYGEHDADNPAPDDAGLWTYRDDPFSSYRAGFEVRTTRLCQRVLMFHHIPDLATGEKGYEGLVRSTDFTYSPKLDPGTARTFVYSFLREVTHTGYRRKTGGYDKRSLSPVAFEYSQPVVQDTVGEVDPASLENLPTGVDGALYQWTDLHGEGIPGILSEQAGAWFYKRNISPISKLPVEFAPVECVATKPNLSLAGGQAQFMDLAGDGEPDLVVLDGAVPGFYEHDDEESWQLFRPFTSRLNRDMRDPNLKFVDLDGDGHADVLITEDDAFVWHPSLAEEGFGPARRVVQPLDEEKGPRLVFADGTQSIYLADLSGDGLTDLVRVRNGEISYWPNLGYGRFGARVTMDQSPQFDNPEQFDQKRIRLADIDGTGAVDVIYLHRDGVRLYFNQSGNSWSQPRQLSIFPRVDDLVSIVPTDLFGNGTACLVWSSPLPGDARQQMRYVDLMGGQKPHLLVKSINNLGAETRVEYAASTKFYLKDKYDGKPWITRLPFPVHVVERVKTWDHISRNHFVTRYAYHHGYFDGEEREFRGFGIVEQYDTEEFAALTADGAPPLAANDSVAFNVPPVLTRTWFHTGVYLGRDHISDFFAGLLDAEDKGEYYREPGLTDDQARAKLLPDTLLPAGLTLDEEREACRALKGSMLRQEVYALDGTDKEEHPYTVVEQNFTIRREQARGENRHAVFFTHAREAISYHYERNPQDPRVGHALTLAVDSYGNVLKSAAIGYGRRLGQTSLDGDDRKKQEQDLITYTENDVTNAIADSAAYPDDYRSPAPYETRTYELTGLRIATDGSRFALDEMLGECGAASAIDYEKTPTAGQKEKRPIEQVRTLYRPDDCGAAQNNALALLPLGTLEPLALPGESYKLAFTPGLARQIYVDSGKLTQSALNAVLADDGRYVHSEGDANWWIPSGRIFLSPGGTPPNGDDTAAEELAFSREHFFLPQRSRDPFHTDAVRTESFLTYDAYDLLMLETRDALNNRVTAGERLPNGERDLTKPGNDYRILQPSAVMDPNRNRAQVAFDILGMVAGTAVMGKPLPAPVEGDSLDGFEADLTQTQLNEFFDPADPRMAAALLLEGATTRIIYDLDRFKRTREEHPDDPDRWLPVCSAIVARETHLSDSLPAGGLRVQVGFSYSDGFGREIQKKIRAEPGPLAPGEPVVDPRWVASGWTIFNNKGKPVRQFEPFFSAAHEFEFGVEVGVSPILFYDPVERVVATLHPNHTYDKVVFDPWQQVTWDVNDTVLIADPGTDADVGEFFRRIPDADYLPTWYSQRQAVGVEAPEKAAADKAAIHADTPSVAHADSLGRTFLTVAHNKFRFSTTPPADSAIEEFYSTRVNLDVEGNQRGVIDANDRLVMFYDYDMLGTRIHQASMEAGERWMLNDVSGKPIRAWDSRGHAFRTEYDPLRRPLRSLVQGADPQHPAEILFGKTEYGEGQPNDVQLNLRTKPFHQSDSAGLATSEAYDFKGNLLRSSLRLAQNYKTIPNWSANPGLEQETFTSRTSYDALNRPVQLIAPRSNQPGAKRNVIQPAYNEANLLERVDVWLDRPTEPAGLLDATTVPSSPVGVNNIDYDAKGQRLCIEYKNGATTRYAYDPQTFRLIHLYTRRRAAFTEDCENPDPPPPTTIAAPDFPPPDKPCGLQNLHYTYDPAGNITHIRDDAQQTIYFNNQVVTPDNDYTYDAIYRLINAEGREHIGQLSKPETTWHDEFRINLQHPQDGTAMRKYTEQYQYDAVGNFKHLIHQFANGGWTRDYAYNEASLIEPGKRSNRLSTTTVGQTTEHYSYDAHGNMTAMPHLTLMQSDFRDHLSATSGQVVNNGTPETTYYVYDAAGQRVRKVTERQNGTRKNERTYLGGFEVYREYDGNGATVALERQTLHVTDDKQRIALVETKTVDGQSPIPNPQPLFRYQFGNHLGSASLELDDAGQIISYEEYYPYGSTSYQAVRSATETPKRYRYAGVERDEESGFGYHGARYYLAAIGRWMSADPAFLEGGINLFSYSGGNPIGRTDRNGLEPVDIGDDPGLRAAATAVHAARPELQNATAPSVPAGPSVTYDVARQQAGTGQTAFRQANGMVGTGGRVQAGHTMRVDQSVATQLPRQVRDNPQSMMALYSRVDPNFAVRTTTNAGTPVQTRETLSVLETIPWQNTNTPHTAQEALIVESTSRSAAASGVPLTREGQVSASQEVLWRTQNTPWDQRNANQVLQSPSTTEAQDIESSPAVAAYRQRTGSFLNAAGGTAEDVTRAVVPGVIEGEAVLLGGGWAAYGAGYPVVGGALLTGAAYVPVIGGGLLGGIVVGNLAEAGARKLGASNTVSKGVGLVGAVTGGATIGALIFGVPTGGTLALPGAVVGGTAGLVGYAGEKLFEPIDMEALYRRAHAR